jgi:hypothetical protein
MITVTATLAEQGSSSHILTHARNSCRRSGTYRGFFALIASILCQQATLSTDIDYLVHCQHGNSLTWCWVAHRSCLQYTVQRLRTGTLSLQNLFLPCVPALSFCHIISLPAYTVRMTPSYKIVSTQCRSAEEVLCFRPSTLQCPLSSLGVNAMMDCLLPYSVIAYLPAVPERQECLLWSGQMPPLNRSRSTFVINPEP